MAAGFLAAGGSLVRTPAARDELAARSVVPFVSGHLDACRSVTGAIGLIAGTDHEMIRGGRMGMSNVWR